MNDLEPPPIEGELITETVDERWLRKEQEFIEEATMAMGKQVGPQIEQYLNDKRDKKLADGGLRKPVKMHKSDYDSDFGLVKVVPHYVEDWSKRHAKQKK